ncbi:hypothetical protein [Nocardia sp. NPDC004860]|uniref:hypothetical protein n=1 Tax=Nocardia sp. NPDC004860 TaxID=3154557 RepID=UPI0033AAF298
MEFVTAVASLAEPDSAVAGFAAGQAKIVPEGTDRRRLLSALLSSAFRDSAPGWLLDVAVDQGLSGGNDRWENPGIGLAAAALAHPDCSAAARELALRRCTERQLADLGTANRPVVLTTAVAVELRRRSPDPLPMTRELLAQPTPAQVVLGTQRLADPVFDAAFELLPSRPERDHRDTGIDAETRHQRYMDRLAAWDEMWSIVLMRHPDRHAFLLERTEDSTANFSIRSLLLGKIPWMVEPALLQDLAMADLDDFDSAVLITQLCRSLRDGEAKQSVKDRFADRIDALDPSKRRRVEIYLDDNGFDPEWGCDEATDWASRAAADEWRLLLNPAEARHYGEPHSWRSSQAELEALGRAFAETTVPALAMWESNPDRPTRDPRLLRWIVEVLTHLPLVTDEVKEAVRPIVDDARKTLRPTAYRTVLYEDRNALEDLVARIDKIVADPAPAITSRRSALGDPTQVTVRELSGAPAEVLADYLDRHVGDDGLVEKVLLAIVSTNYGPKPGFGDVLERHSDPNRAIRELTYDLRRRLGGNPAAREQWAREILALPNCDSDVVRALPAWTALKLSGTYGNAHPEIIALVTDALGDDAAAWQRLADSPISYTGASAWLRLGEVLDAARSGGDWPTRPSRSAQ